MEIPLIGLQISRELSNRAELPPGLQLALAVEIDLVNSRVSWM